MIFPSKRASQMADPERVEEIKRAILDRLRVALKVRGISMQEASENADLGEQYVSRISRGASNPTLDNLILVCLANGISLYEIILDEKEANEVRAMRSFRDGLPGALGSREEIAQALQADWTARVKMETSK